MSARFSYVIEIEDEAVGLVIPTNDDRRSGVIFHAVHPKAQALHGRSFDDPQQATRAASVAMGRAA
ncbi:hypothetical protein [Rhodocista pekingensis]|uniref:Type II toxin-antitoxin system HicB family antitoxin n=1 Tax=Rhodocista pekingensis TaxID=201185 RepID=A0ABW2KR20_9PROT